MAAHHKVRPLIMLACPVFMAVERNTYHSHQELVFYCGRHMPEYDFCIGMIPERTSVAKARNEIVKAALASDVDWILWLDDDQEVPKDALPRLLAHKKDIVCGLSFVRTAPFHAMIMHGGNLQIGHMWMDDYPEGLVECAVSPFACALTNIKVFKRIVKPWFWDKPDGYSEDVYFAQKAREAGFKVYVDTTVKTTHMGERLRVDEDFAKRYWALVKERTVPVKDGQDKCPIPPEVYREFRSLSTAGVAVEEE